MFCSFIGIVVTQVCESESCSAVSNSLRPVDQSTEFSRPEYWSGQPFPSPGIFPTQGSNPGLPHCRGILYQLSHKGSIYICNNSSSYISKICAFYYMCTIPRTSQVALVIKSLPANAGDIRDPGSIPLSSPSPPALNLSKRQGLFQ